MTASGLGLEFDGEGFVLGWGVVYLVTIGVGREDLGIPDGGITGMYVVGKE